MGEFQNVQRGTIFLWFFTTVVFTIFIIIKLVKNQIDPKDCSEEEKYRQGQKNKKQQQAAQSIERFDESAIKQDRPEEDDTVIQRWLKRLHEDQVYYLPILFPFALNIVTGTSYSFIMIIFFICKFCLLIFNLWKVHRQCVEHPVLRILLESIGYILSFFMLLNVWVVSPSPMPYTIIKG